jgi:hypothetical protein
VLYHFSRSSCGRREKRAGCGRVRSRNICFSTYSLQFAKAGSAATPPRQEKNNSADLQRGIVITKHYPALSAQWQVSLRGNVFSVSSSRYDSSSP